MKEFVDRYRGVLVALVVAIALTRFPIYDGGILPDPIETLFDWGGEVVGMTWIAIAWFVITYGPCFAIAGMLDRCSTAKAFSVLLALSVIGSVVFLLPTYLAVNGAIVGVLGCCFLFPVYLAARRVSAACRRHWMKRNAGGTEST